jgi:hypothetical protein
MHIQGVQTNFLSRKKKIGCILEDCDFVMKAIFILIACILLRIWTDMDHIFSWKGGMESGRRIWNCF